MGQPKSTYRVAEYVCVLHPGNSMGSSGSRERSLDSDSDLEEMTGTRDTTKSPSLAKQASETSTEDEHLSPRTSLDLSVHPPPLPESEPPQDAESAEQDRDASSPGPWAASKGSSMMDPTFWRLQNVPSKLSYVHFYHPVSRTFHLWASVLRGHWGYCSAVGAETAAVSDLEQKNLKQLT